MRMELEEFLGTHSVLGLGLSFSSSVQYQAASTLVCGKTAIGHRNDQLQGGLPTSRDGTAQS